MNRRAFLRTAAGLGALGAATTAYAGLVEPDWVDFTSPGAPAGWPTDAGFAHLSDLHLGSLDDAHDAIVAEIRRRRPPLLLLTGDTVDEAGALPALDELLGQLPDVTPLAILGNWEYWGRVDPGSLARLLERHGGRLLINESLRLGDLVVTGLDDWVAGSPDPTVVAAAPEGAAHVLLAHCPVQRDYLPSGRTPDLVLSGHTHGGQVRPLGVAAFRPRGSGRYLAGWYRDGNGAPPLYVSRGVGTSVLPFRLGARPEVAFYAA
jgi:predicted MPP superfamily phosphohydrolase